MFSQNTSFKICIRTHTFKYTLPLSETKTKVMTFLRQVANNFQNRNRCTFNGQPIKNVTLYLFDMMLVMSSNTSLIHLHEFQLMCGTIYWRLHNKAMGETKLKFYKEIMTPMLRYGRCKNGMFREWNLFCWNEESSFLILLDLTLVAWTEAAYWTNEWGQFNKTQ